ncbi:MAG: BMC domain-containing protein [Melioribacteraceae bacterium]|nr:MAG: BMC domain-containing protein [Melioribacteraceae bacterium]
MQLALGLIETKGLIGAIEAADAGTKAANVKLISKELATGALVLVKFEGEVAAVKSAVDAASAAAQRVGQLVSAHVIPRPDDQIDEIVYGSKIPKQGIPQQKTVKKAVKKDHTIVANTSLFDVQSPEIKEEILEEKIEEDEFEIEEELQQEEEITKLEEKTSEVKPIPPMKELEILNVHQLRKLARGFENFPIKGRDISKANRGTLLDFFKKM